MANRSGGPVNVPALRRIRYAAFLLLFVAAGAYVGVWLQSSDTHDRVRQAAATTLPAKMPVIELSDLDGNMHSVAQFTTGGPLIVNFWATWCAPCLREMPMLESVWQARGRGSSAQIVGIAIDRLSDVEPYVRRTGVNYPILVGQSDAMEAAETFGAAFAGLPFTVFALPGGDIVHAHAGELERARVDEILGVLDAVVAGELTLGAARRALEPCSRLPNASNCR